jgi:hypothetical protein
MPDLIWHGSHAELNSQKNGFTSKETNSVNLEPASS